MILLRKKSGIIQVNKDSEGWITVPKGEFIIHISEDRLNASIRATDSYLYDVDRYPINDILDADNGNTPFDADSLEQYFIDADFFNPAPSTSGYGTGAFIIALSTNDQIVDNEEKVLLMPNILESKGITVENDSEFIFDLSGS